MRRFAAIVLFVCLAGCAALPGTVKITGDYTVQAVAAEQK